MDVILDHSFGGINSSIPGIGGPQCVKFLPLWQRIAETFLLVPLAICGIIISSKNLEPFLLPISGKMLSSINESAVMFDDDKNLVRYCVLAFYCFIFGSEIVCKLVRRVFVFILNPCHIATTIQILILAIGITNHRMYYLFRFQMYLLPGALIGTILPSINSRVLFVEVLIYFIQHVAILIVPFFIVYVNGTFLLEPFQNFVWAVLSFSVILCYHFTILQIVGLITEANMGCVICPAMSDPFYGRFYRLATVIHQAILIPLITEVFSVCIKCVTDVTHLNNVIRKSKRLSERKK
ncbi:unnamed protein product [Brugia pahangi]|uniref:Transmembrane protein 164 n=1 Tax=Brugia pahangi TaxID=6280 RepID=A0A0N4SZJ7_BRUPA|nr:unnamed protein product [Brugia pahangi]